MNNEQILNRSDATTLAVQLKNIFRAKIANGEWPPDSMIPSENRLSEMYGVSRMTIRAVLTEFVSHGYMYRIPGKGTFISEDKLEISSLQYSGIRGQLEEMGHSVETRLLYCGMIPAKEFEAEKLSVMSGTPLYLIKRLRKLNGTPVSYHESYVPAQFCPNLDDKPLESMQLCHIMSRDYGLKRDHVLETLESFSADRELGKAFGVKPGFPLLLLEDRLYLSDNRLYEYSRVYFRGDKTKIRIEYHD